MSKSTFASLVIRQLDGSVGRDGSTYTSATPGQANTAIALAITEYITTKIKLNITYLGTTITAPPTPDTGTDSVMILGTCAPPVGIDFNSWLASIETNIMAGFLVGSGEGGIIPMTPTNAFILPGLSTFITQSMLRSEHENNLEDPQRPVWEAICGGIIDWIDSSIVKTYQSTRTGISTGISTVTSVIQE